MTYQVRLYGQKTVEKINSETGARKELPGLVYEWSDTFEMSSRPCRDNMLAHLTSFLHPKSGLTAHCLSHLPNRPGLFIARQPEDSASRYDEKGSILATYVIQVSCRTVEPMRPLDDTMGTTVAEDGVR